MPTTNYVMPPARRPLALLLLVLALAGCDGTNDLATGPEDNASQPAAEAISSPAFSATGTYTGIPFGSTDLWRGTTPLWGPAPFTSSDNYTQASTVVEQIAAARAVRHRLILNMTGGGHLRYKTNGKFDLAKWKAVMNTYDSPAIKEAVQAAVADGTVIMNSVMDEPNVADWGGVMTKPLLDEMASYVKRLFPTLPVAVTVRHDWRLNEHYRVVDAILTNYRWNKGDVISYRDDVLNVARQDGIAVAFSLNVLDGGIIDYESGSCPIPLTGGVGTYAPACRMTAQQVRDWGLTLGVAGCALNMWQYDAAFMSKADNQQAFRDIAAKLAAATGRSCRRTAAAGTTTTTNLRPTAAFTIPQCAAGLACKFTDGSADPDGTIAGRTWSFGNGQTSLQANPSITYQNAGTYSVTLTVKDDRGATGTVTKNVLVTTVANTALVTLNLSGSVVDNRQYVMLTWSGLNGSSVDVYRDGGLLLRTSNDNRQNTIIPLQGKASYTYKVCEAGKTRCSATLTFRLPAILLNVTAWMKEPGLQAMRLQWAGASGTTMDVYRNGVRIDVTLNTGRYTNTRRYSGAATYVYKVCVTGTAKCSNTDAARF